MAEKNPEKEFFLSSWAIDRPTLIYVIVSLFFILGISAYFNMPRENFPEVKETKIYISSLYPGNTAEDVERLITDPLEDRLKNISNVVEITSTSQEDFSIIIVEFDEEISVENAKQKVKDEVDTEKSNEDWPTFNNAKIEPNVFDLNLSEEIPIMNINITGDYPIEQLKYYAEIIQDEVENISEIKQADLRGVQDLEVEVAVDIYQMMAAKVSFDDVINSIRNGNITISGGNLISSDQRRTIRVIGEIDEPKDLNKFVVKDLDGAVYLKDLAQVSFHEKEKTSYARTYGEPVVMLDVKKRAGKNMIEAVDKIKATVKRLQVDELPKDIHISYANDQSEKTLNQVSDLVNNIIFGILLVITIIMFFIGFRNALFIGFAIPMSMFISFMLLSLLGYTLNTMILFGLIMGLGMLVDNGIVVVENVYRLMDEEGMSRIEAAKKGIGEIAMPIIVSTITTVAAFIPLGLWPGIMGEFMILFPITLSVVLGSSLFVAIFVNSMLVSQFMETEEKNLSRKQLIRLSLILIPLGILILIFGGEARGLGSVILVTALMFWVYKYFIKRAAISFQQKFLVKIETLYENILRFALRGVRPYVLSFLMLVLFIAVNGLYFGWSVGSGRTKVEFFPDNKPNQIIVYVEYPEGTDIEKTNKLTKALEALVYEEIQQEEYQYQGRNLLVESAVSQVGEGAGNPQTDMGNTAEMPHRAKITATMPEFKYRRGKDSETLRQRIQEKLEGKFPGVLISVEKDAVGPPAGYPINIELIGKDYDEMIVTAEQMIDFINSKNIDGIESLKIDVNKKKPILKVAVDREKSGALGMSAAQIGNQLRRSIFGEKAGVFKKDGEDYDIYVRFNENDRHDISTLLNQRVTFRDMATGVLKEIPLSAVANFQNTAGFSAIKHKNTQRVVTVYSALKPGFTDAGAVVAKIEREMTSFDMPENIKIDFTGQIEEQNKQMAFLMTALISGLGLIFFILIFQFNSISKPLIVMISIFFSFIGVFLGLMVTGWPFVIMMTMMGIIALAGVVVNNSVVLIDYIDILKVRAKNKLQIEHSNLLPSQDAIEAIVKGGKARLRPVLLTAFTTVLGLIPLAIGLNIDFFGLATNFDAGVYIGGDNVIFWGPLAWTVIFGLIFATFLTLIVVPVLLLIVHKIKLKIFTKRQVQKLSKNNL